jgi:hypothetical protein
MLLCGSLWKHEPSGASDVEILMDGQEMSRRDRHLVCGPVVPFMMSLTREVLLRSKIVRRRLAIEYLQDAGAVYAGKADKVVGIYDNFIVAGLKRMARLKERDHWEPSRFLALIGMK